MIVLNLFEIKYNTYLLLLNVYDMNMYVMIQSNKLTIIAI